MELSKTLSEEDHEIPWEDRGYELSTPLTKEEEDSLKGWEWLAQGHSRFSNGVDAAEVKADIQFFESVQSYPHGYVPSLYSSLFSP